MAKYSTIKKTLAQQQLAPHKKLGQNFLVHAHTAERIVRLATIKPDDTVVELGVGLGALTLPLAATARQVIGIEIDSGIVRLHQENKDLPDNVTLIHQDLLKADFQALAAQCGGLLKIIANLPYSVSNPLLFKLIENSDHMAWAVLMLQKEVGQRLIAQVGTKEYGVLSVLLGACAKVEKLMELGPQHFHPRPKVDSVVVRITFTPPPELIRNLPPYDKQLFRRIVKSGFQKRRKTLLNALSTSALLSYDKATVRNCLEAVQLNPSSRAENLTLHDYIGLTTSFSQIAGL